MFIVRTEDEIAKLMLTNNCYKCSYIHYYSGTPEMPIGWCRYLFEEPKELLCSKYKESLHYDLNVSVKQA